MVVNLGSNTVLILMVICYACNWLSQNHVLHKLFNNFCSTTILWKGEAGTVYPPPPSTFLEKVSNLVEHISKSEN